MGRFFGTMTLAVLLVLPSVSHTDEGRRITGKLLRYTSSSVVVAGTRIPLCRDCTIYDDQDNEISIDGLVATEEVMVILKGGCASRVKSTLVRK
jgi:hypothetical protein